MFASYYEKEIPAAVKLRKWNILRVLSNMDQNMFNFNEMVLYTWAKWALADMENVKVAKNLLYDVPIVFEHKTMTLRSIFAIKLFEKTWNA